MELCESKLKNTIYVNKTYEYLYPSLRKYGNELLEYLNSFLKVAVGIDDYNIDLELNKDKSIFILIDTDIYTESKKSVLRYKEKFSKFLDWLSYQKFYISDYLFEKNKHMIVIRLPISDLSYTNFLQSNYSKIYTKEEINKYHFKENIKSILLKNTIAKINFVSILNNKFNVDMTIKDIINFEELDLPLNIKDEIFNYL